ncbi:hypothetical protein GH714_001424 [Hevea brasiliensis]|uniref:Uncharacterized protein n=1 Tax=Hevea brasiliensis TaxID=3981 RepID=A0A6A6LX10_HEVBR|nr:hypothetical protein GH714_001424 [Hevea brasiliensis]
MASPMHGPILPTPNGLRSPSSMHGLPYLCPHEIRHARPNSPNTQRSLFSSEGRIFEKNGQTPVTMADFGVQALVSLELSKLFPSSPLVAEEDSSFLRSNNLVDSVVLDPIDGTRVLSEEMRPYMWVRVAVPVIWNLGITVGLALVVEGEIALGVMGCPNWPEEVSNKSITEVCEYENLQSGSGILMVAHVGCGTWTKRLSNVLGRSAIVSDGWTKCIVDGCRIVPEARFCVPESQTCESLPLSALFNATNDADSIDEKEILLLSTCCRSLCKYLTVACGRASVFILRARTQRIIKVWDHAVGVICVHEAGERYPILHCTFSRVA